ncbi:MAG: hypothetical protein M0T77_02180 [Actinomycetota bacterium]|nr:hypothetical protein [Actinomycetota bacterium]
MLGRANIRRLRFLRAGLVGLPAVAAILCTVLVGVAAAAPVFRIRVAPRVIGIGGRVTITTRPVERCVLTVDIARRKFSHLMPYGWIQVTMPRSFRAGRVGVVVNCGGRRRGGSFLVR